MSEAYQVIEEIEKVILGKRECVEEVWMALLSKGHVLIEDIPGTGKTTLAMAFARVFGLNFSRIQFTPDITPSDIVGFSMFDKELNKFVYHPGTVMANLVLADEINRASTRSQSAFLEVMEENTVTVDGNRYAVPQPFFVIATENPLGAAGTQMLPESQLDRFMICVEMGYPSMEDEIRILENQIGIQSVVNIRNVISAQQLKDYQRQVEEVYISPEVYEYIVSLSKVTRNHSYVELGLSVRGTRALASMAKAKAFLNDRNFVIPEDVLSVFDCVSRHRLILNGQARMNQMNIKNVMEEIIQQVPRPRAERKAKR